MKTSLKVLQDLKWSMKCLNTKMPPNYVPKTTYTDKTANGLTKCICDWLICNGWQSERISNMGRYIDNSKIVKDVLGQSKRIGTGKYIKGSGTKGTADISATIKGRSVKIEVKIGKDIQSEAQKKYQKSIEDSGGIYIIISDFDYFIMWYKSFVESI